MSTAHIARQSSSYRQGLVLGLTMAEVMLLLVFCLLLALATLFSKQQAELIEVRKDLAEAESNRAAAEDKADQEKLTRASAEGVSRMLAETPQLQEALRAKSGSSSSEAISEFWRKLTESEAVVNEFERNGVSRADALKSAKYIKEARSLAVLGMKPEDIKRNADLGSKIREKVAGRSAATDAAILELVQKGLTEDSSGAGHLWPPIIKLTDADGVFFESGKATLTPQFESKIRGLIQEVITNAQKYQTDIIEVVGHTDEQRINPRVSNLDKELLGALSDHSFVDKLLPGDNAGLGLARAVSVVGVLKAENRLSGYKILPLSGAQLINPDDTLVSTFSLKDAQDRRRIEIRLRKSTPSTDASRTVGTVAPAGEQPVAGHRSAPPRLPKVATPRPKRQGVVPRSSKMDAGSQMLEEAPAERVTSSPLSQILERAVGYDPAGR